MSEEKEKLEGNELEDRLDKEYHSGVVGEAIHIEPEKDGNLIVTARVNDLKVMNEDRDEVSFVILGSMFKHIFQNLDLKKVRTRDIYLAMEIPIDQFQKEWQVLVEKTDLHGGEYRLNDEEIGDFDPTKFVPKVKVKEDTDEDKSKDSE